MPRFVKETTIHAPASRVWKTLEDLGNIADWNPGVHSSKLESDLAHGVGARRSCQVKGGYLMEQVTDWEDEKRLAIKVTDTNLPFKRAEPHYELSETDGTTHVKLVMDYDLRFGVIGKILDRLMINRMLQSGMEEQLEGLKKSCEQSRHIANKTS